MLKLKNIRFCLMLFMLLCCRGMAQSAPPSGAVKVGDLYYMLDKTANTASVTYNSGEYQTDNNYSTLTSITIPSSITSGGKSYSVVEIGFGAFNGSTRLTSITIPSSVRTLGERCFFRTGLSSVTLPTGVTKIPARAFAEAKNLRSVNGLDNIIWVMENAFSNCGITSVSLPNVEVIEGNAFYSCSSLTSVGLGTKLTKLGYASAKGDGGSGNNISGYTFWGCSRLTKITLPASLKSVAGALENNFTESTAIDCKSTTPPAATSNSTSSLRNRLLLVPSSAESAYKNTDPWKYFTINPVMVSSITFAANPLELVKGQSRNINAKAEPSNAAKKTLEFVSANRNVATVDFNGIVTAVAAGTTYITAKATDGSGVTANCTVTVTNPVVAESVTLNKASLTLVKGKSETLTATVLPDNTYDKTVTWTSSNSNIAKVSEGKITAVAVGNATIMAKCGNASSSCAVTVVGPAATSVRLDKTSATVKDTERLQLTATVSPSDVTDPVVWTSSDTSVASVSSNGLVTASKVGSATITATCGAKSAACVVTVTATPASKVTLNHTTLTLKAAQIATIQATVTPDNATDKTVTWTTSNASAATVNSQGVVTGVAVGTARITATCGNVSATCDVTVAETPATSVSLNYNNAKIKVKGALTLIATVFPETTTDKSITWSSSDSRVATVDANGMVTGVGVGDATITAAAKSGVTASCGITVEPTPAEGVSLNLSEVRLRATQTARLTATVLPETTTDKDVSWSSSDSGVATVDANGVVTAVAVGEATITASTKNGKAAGCKVTVEPTPAESVTIDTPEKTTLLAGESLGLKVNVFPATTTDQSVTFSSSDATVATVDENGVVTAVGVGTVVITVTAASGVQSTITIIVDPTPADSVALDKSEITLKATETAQLTATILPATTTDKTVTWSSSDDKVAEVDSNGKVTAVAVGNAMIIATAASGKTASCSVNVEPTPVETIEIDKSEAKIKVDESLQLSATVLPELATDKSVLWSSSDETVAKVDETGLVTAVAVGEAVITATASSDVKGECRIVVEPVLAESISLDAESLTIGFRTSVQLSVKFSPENVTEKAVSWKSSDELIATVDANGMVSGVGIGNAVITASTVDGSDLSASCEVTVDNGDIHVAIEPASVDVNVGEMVQLTPVVEGFDEGETLEYAWSSSNEEIASIDSGGNVAGVAVGSAVISLTVTDTHGVSFMASASVTVDKEDVVSDIFAAGEEEEETAVYTLEGLRVADRSRMMPGVYIVRCGREIKKVIVR